MKDYIEKDRLPPGYKQGRYKVFYSTKIPASRIQLTKLTKNDYILLLLLASLSICVRLYKLPYPPSVVFDEVHFGGFAREYYLGRFFLDVHPPLVKLIYYWIACLGGYDGQFGFEKIGYVYPQEVPYILMRLFPALCGVFTILVSYLILRKSSCRLTTSWFGASLLLIENSLITQSRFILLDSPLILGIAICLYGVKRSQVEIPFTRPWVKSLVITGWGAGLTLSSKANGILTYIWLLSLTGLQLWYYLGDLDLTDWTWYKHVFVRFATIVLFPLTTYLAVFYVHFASVPNQANGSGAFSPDFQAALNGNNLANQPVEVLYGSTITIKHQQVGSYLHSHNHTYPKGSQEQQVTLYGFNNDYNNEWIIETINKNIAGKLQQQRKPIKDMDKVRLYHKGTGKYLRVNNVRPPMSEHDYCMEVSCNGDRDMLADTNYEFQVSIVDKRSNAKNNLADIKLRATESVFQLIHRGTRCTMISHDQRLPKWGFEQNEVLCLKEPTIPNTLWYIETNSHPLLDNDPESERVDLKNTTFWHKLWEYHLAMFKLNRGLTSEHAYESRPETWPFTIKGINYFTQESDHSQIYLLGNVAIYYTGFILVLLIMMKQGLYILLHLNPFAVPYEPLSTTLFYETSLELILGWVINYFPSFHMERQLFLHHYLPSVYFMTMLIPIYVEYQISKRKYIGYPLMILIMVGAIYCYYQFLPLIYGTGWTKEQCLESKWFDSWTFNCMTYA